MAPILLSFISLIAFSSPAHSLETPAPRPLDRSPGFSTAAGECLETVRAAIARETATDPGTTSGNAAAYLAHEAEADALIKARRTKLRSAQRR